METYTLQGTEAEQRLAGWLLNLFALRGFSFALDAVIEFEQAELVSYFMEKGLDWFYRIITRPWRYLRLLRLLLFYTQVLWQRLRK
ncbi:MAG: hypothetical protein ACP5TV_07370 [Anaerolineae bacterium]